MAKSKIVDTNPAGGAFLGLKRSEIVRRSGREFLCWQPEGGCPFLNLDTPLHRLEKDMLNRNDEPTPVLVSIVPMHVRGKKHLVHFCLDIREQKAVHNRLLAEQREKVKLIRGLS
jgi:PAS domain-containing protein